MKTPEEILEMWGPPDKPESPDEKIDRLNNWHCIKYRIDICEVLDIEYVELVRWWEINSRLSAHGLIDRIKRTFPGDE